MQPHYYLMKNKKILRLEAGTTFESLTSEIRETALDELESMDQSQANWRVAIFRDEIMEYEEYREWLSSPEALALQDQECDLIAN